MIEGVTVQGVARLPVTIIGGLSTPVMPDLRRLQLWEGSAASREPIAAIAFLRYDKREVAWARSERRHHRWHWLPVGTLPLTDQVLEIRLTFSPDDERGLRVGIHFGIGGGITGAGSGGAQCALPTPGYLRDMPVASKVETGTVTRLATIEGDPKVEFLALFLARRDTKGGRNRNWHLRRSLRDGLQPQMQEVLAYGRSGYFED